MRKIDPRVLRIQASAPSHMREEGGRLGGGVTKIRPTEGGWRGEEGEIEGREVLYTVHVSSRSCEDNEEGHTGVPRP